jgi:hypothetical protein
MVKPTRCVSFLGVSANLALHEKTGESSKYMSDTEGNKAVDGRVDDVKTAQHFASALPNDDHDPYWYVELDDMYLVQTVEIISRRDCCVDRIETIEVRVGMYNDLLIRFYFILLFQIRCGMLPEADGQNRRRKT